MKRCKHLTTSFVCKTTNDQRIIATARFCGDCGRHVSLGPSNDAPADVQVEIRAAKLFGISTKIRPLSVEEDRGWNLHGWNLHEIGRDHAQSARQSSGWLAREIATHYDRETRDADAWSWDITRLVAGQYEEQIESAARGRKELERLQAVREYRICEHTRHDVAASVARHADLSPGDAFMARTADMERITGDEARAVVGGQHLPSTGRVPYAEDQLPLPAVNLTPPHHVELEISIGDEPELGIEVEIVDVDDDALIAEIASAPARAPDLKAAE